MRSHLFAALSACLLFGSIAACADVDDDIEEADLEEGIDDEKSDRPNLGLTEVSIDASLEASDSRVGVIKSKTAFKSVFGVDAPSSVNFSTHWVAFYIAGTQTSGGYTATIQRVRLSDTGKTLKISTNLDKPGPNCVNAAVLTNPYAIVR